MAITGNVALCVTSNCYNGPPDGAFICFQASNSQRHVRCGEIMRNFVTQVVQLNLMLWLATYQGYQN